MAEEIRVALLGTKFMGKAHSNAFSKVSQFFQPKLKPVMAVVCGRDPKGTRDLADKFGWQEASTDWKEVVRRADIGLVDVSTTGDTHLPMVAEAAKAGKAIFCEKPLANTLPEARAMLVAVKKAGVPHMINFNYRFTPAVSLARQFIKSGKLGRIFHWRSVYLQDWIVDPAFPMVWRLDKKMAGSGALGDIAAHSIDMARFLVGDIEEVSGMMQTFIKERNLLASSSAVKGLGAKAGKGKGKVTVDDAVAFLARFKSGVFGTFEATRFATGRKNFNGWEINGEKGTLVFNFEDMNRLQFYDRTQKGSEQGFKTIMVTEADHPYAGAWWPAGHIIGYEHTFVHAVYELLNHLAERKMPSPNFEDGVRCQEVLEAVERSAKSKKWVKVDSV
jgi:predicted dehydrogenase